MSEPLSRGYATANTDTGHEGPSTEPKFALEDPEHLIDFGYRAVHEMTAKAKDIVAAFYGRTRSCPIGRDVRREDGKR